ncbi:MAG: sulfur carrier protein ThiS [Phycisphaerales bacterium]
MNCTVNGESTELPDGTTVSQLIELLGLSDAICAAEVGENLVPKREREARVLVHGDKVEIVTLVGGG